MRAKVSIRASAKVAALLASLLSSAACANVNRCAPLNEQVERVRSGTAQIAVSDRVSVRTNRTARPNRAMLQQPGDFPALGAAAVHDCLGADWVGSVDADIRESWHAPAIRYRRAGWPDVVVLEDDDKLEIRIEPAL